MRNWRGILTIKGLISRRSSHGIRDVTFLGAARRKSPQLANKVYSYSGDLPYLYDHVLLYAARTDVQFYVDEAKRSGGRILEIGCGTGRVLLPIARAGLEIVGVDAAQGMLDRCATKLATEPTETRRRVELQLGDARNSNLDSKFDLVIAPFRVFQHQVSI